MVDAGDRYDTRDRQYKILDVNPRIGSTFRHSVGRHGVDVVRAHFFDLTGQSVPPHALTEGRKWLTKGRKWMDERDFQSGLEYWRNGELSFRQWAASLRDPQEFVYVALDDPAPAARLAVYIAKGGRRRPRR